jgi:divalent metal cation (Fe/Co/Zn/Cd) transporter
VDELYRRWETPRCFFGDIAVLSFVIVQCLDGVFTYLGVRLWGPAIEANPIVSSTVQLIGLGAGLTTVKLVAVGLGILLHLRRVHNVVALLTAIYVAAAILPWTALFIAP